MIKDKTHSCKLLCRAVFCFLLAICLTVQGSVFNFAGVMAETGAEGGTGSGPAGENLISVNMVDADIRDVLSTLAISLNVNIIYLDAPVRVTFAAKDVSPMKAFEMLIQSAGSQLGYLKDGNVIIVGGQQKLQKDFFNQMALTRFKLNYISPEVLSEQLDKLGVPIQKITLDESSSYIWAQGTPQALSKLASVIAALDRAENFDNVDGKVKSSINLTPVYLDYITADKLEKLIQQLEIPVQTIRVDANPMVLWVNGPQQAKLDVEQLAAQVDVIQSAGESFDMSSYALKYLTYDKLLAIKSQLSLPVDIIRVGEGQKSIWIKGTQKDIQDLLSMLAKLDISDNSDECQFFVYTLRYISPEDASARLDFLAISGVKTMVLNYPQFTRELLVKCPFDMIGTVSRILGNVDVQGQKIRVPVDYGNIMSQLTKRKELISRLLDIPLDRINISDNIARGGTQPYYVMWVEDTPDNIKKIREMIALIDDPAESGG
jgi:hypothetical protein